ncbi:MAG: ribosome silencing factor [bacterium]
MISRTLAKKMAAYALSKKAFDVLLMDLRGLDGPADFFVLCSADSETQVKAIADAVQDGMLESEGRPWHSEGWKALSWVLLDYVDIVVHVFHKEARSFYSVERLWGDAKRTQVEDTPTGIMYTLESAAIKRKTTGKKRSPKLKSK